jgi:predicted ATPase
LAPYLTNISIHTEGADNDRHPFNIPFAIKGQNLPLSSAVTYFIGENGAGKSSILEGIADSCGFNLAGGNRNHRFGTTGVREETLAAAMRLSWRKRIAKGFFLRAESFYNFAAYIDNLEAEEGGLLDGYGGKSLLGQSHGESFFELFNHRFSEGIYILDEPEAALSPQRQYSFMMLMSELEQSGKAQFIIATHAPILLCYPKAIIYNVSPDSIVPVPYQETEHFLFTKNFLNTPGMYTKYLKH